MQTLNLSIVQSSLTWEDPEENINHLDSLISKHFIGVDTDIVVLPEMFNSGFTMNAEKVAESMDGKSVKWMQEISGQLKCLVFGSIVIKEKENYYNRMIVTMPSSQIIYYDKRHLFRLAKEQEHYQQGNDRVIVKWKDWSIAPFVCYDLRFPVWLRNDLNDNNGYDLAIFVANWPQKRASQWRRLLKARAIENQCFVAGVNRVGKDANDITYRGDSCVLDYYGEYITHMVNGEGIQTITIDKKKLLSFREHFPFWMDADQFELK